MLASGSCFRRDDVVSILSILEGCLKFVSAERTSAAEVLSLFIREREKIASELRVLFPSKTKNETGSDPKVAVKDFNPEEVTRKLWQINNRWRDNDLTASTAKAFVVNAVKAVESEPKLDKKSDNFDAETQGNAEAFYETDFVDQDTCFLSHKVVSVTDQSVADQEDMTVPASEPQGWFFVQTGRHFDGAVDNYDELRNTCDRSFINQSMYIGHNTGIDIEVMDVREDIESDVSD